MADGILINTCEELEQIPIKALQENSVLKRIPTPPIYPVGPLKEKVQQSQGIRIRAWIG